MWTRVCILGNVRVTSLVNRATRDRTRTVCARSYRSFLQSLRFDSSLDYSSSLVLTTPRSIERLNMNEEEERFFCAGRWKHARIFAIVHLVFEVIGFFMLIASGLFIYSGAMGPVLAIIGESLAVGVCCRGDRGKGVAIASVALNSIALIFAGVSLCAASAAICDDSDYSCDYYYGWIWPKVIVAYESVGLILKVTAVVLASRLSCARPAQWGVVANADAELGIPVTIVIPLYCMTTRSRHERKRVRDAAIGSVVVIGIGCADDHVFARNCDTRAKVVIRGCVRGRRERVRAHPLHIT